MGAGNRFLTVSDQRLVWKIAFQRHRLLSLTLEPLPFLPSRELWELALTKDDDGCCAIANLLILCPAELYD